MYILLKFFGKYMTLRSSLPFVSIALLVLSMSSCANAKTVTKVKVRNDAAWMYSDSVVSERLGDSIMKVVVAPDSVKCFHVSYREKVKESDYLVVKSFVRDSLITHLNEGQIAVMQFVLLSEPRNYTEKSTIVKSPYWPTVEFEFYKKDFVPVSVVVSTLNQSWQVLRSRVEVTSFNFEDEELIKRYINVFNKE